MIKAGEIKDKIKKNLFLLHVNLLLSMKTMIYLSIQVLRSVPRKKLNQTIFPI